MSHRPLAIVTGLTIGDYLLWNWSLNYNHDVLSLVSGLTLPPLAIALLWLLALTVARLIARGTRARARAGARSAAARKATAQARDAAARERTPGSVTAASGQPRSSRKIAA